MLALLGANVSLGLSPAHARAQAPVDPVFADFSEVSGDSTITAYGGLNGAAVMFFGQNEAGSVRGGTSIVDGAGTRFADAAVFTPALPTSDVVAFGAGPGARFALRFGRPVRNPVLHLGSVGATLTFLDGDSERPAPVTRISGGGAFTVSGNTVTGSAQAGQQTAASGTVELSGTFTGIDLRAEPLPGAGDSIEIQVGSLPPRITTIGGTGSAGYDGDNLPATQSRLSFPIGLATFAAGGVLIADQVNHRVRLLDRDGVLRAIAGSGTAGFGGDGGPATLARLNAPTGVAQLPDGSVLIADADNNRIRRVDAAGTITTVAGNGNAAFSGDGGPATAAALRFPTGLAVASDGSYLIADFDNNRVRRVSAGGQISTFAGGGGDTGEYVPATTAALAGPRDVDIDADGGVLIAERNRNRVRRVEPQEGQISTVAGTGVAGSGADGSDATRSALRSPSGVSAEADGAFVVADTGNHRVRRVSLGRAVTTLAGTGAAGSSGDGGPAPQAQLNTPFGVAFAPGGDLLIADTYGQRVRRIDVGVVGGAPPPLPPPPPPSQTTPAVPTPSPPTAPSPPPPVPVARNVVPPEVEVGTASNGTSTYRCSDGEWTGLARDPRFFHGLYEASAGVSQSGPLAPKLLPGNPYVLKDNAQPRPLFCWVSARTASGGTIFATGPTRLLPSLRVRFQPLVAPKTIGDLRIRGIDVLQVVQPSTGAGQYSFKGFPEPSLAFASVCGGGTPTSLLPPGCAAAGAVTQKARYQGVQIDRDKRARVVVYLDRRDGVAAQLPDQQIQVRLRATAGARLNASLIKTLRVKDLQSSPTDAVSAAERGDERFGVLFELPEDWLFAATSPTDGSFDLTATVSALSASYNVRECSTRSFPEARVGNPDCSENNSFTLTDVPARSLPFSAIFRTVGLTTPGHDLTSLRSPSSVMDGAREVLPSGEKFQIPNFVAQLPIDPATAMEAKNCPAPKTPETADQTTSRRRKCASAAAENAIRAWVAAGPASTAEASPSDGFDVLLALHHYTYAPGTFEAGGQFGSSGVGAWARHNNQPYIHIDDGTIGRPLTSAAHELVHAMGAPHAGINAGPPVGDLSCGGDTDGQVGEAWPPGDSGALEGVQITAAGDRVVDDPTTPLFDLMSYCADEGNAWLSPRNWNRAVAFMLDAQQIVPRRFQIAIRRPRSRAAAAAPGAGLSVVGAGFVVGQVVSGQARITGLAPADPEHDVPAGDPASPLRVRAFAADGRPLAEVGARLTRDTTIGTLTFIAPVPAGAAAVELVAEGAVADRRVKSRAPTLTLAGPRRVGRVRRALDLSWRARDADGDALTAAVEFSPDGRRGWRTILRGASTGHAVLPATLLQRATAARVRVTVTDGFASATATSGPLRVDGRPPTATIVRPVVGEAGQAGARVVLLGRGLDETGKRLRGRALTWFSGTRRLGTGERLRVRLPAGRARLRLVASDRHGRKGSTRRTLRIAPVPLELRTLRARRAARGARRVTVTVATNVAAVIAVGARRQRVGPSARRIRLPLPARPALGVVPVALRLTPSAGGPPLRITLTVLRG